MQKFKDWLKPISDYFLSGFSDTFQLLLDNFLGDYLEDPKQLNMTTLIKGIEMLQLNKAFINQLLGQCPFRLEEAYIESIKVASLKFEARGLKLVFAFTDKINVEELKAYLQKTQELKLKEISKLEQLNKLRDEVYKECQFEQSQDLQRSMGPQTGLIQFLSLVDTLLSNSSITFKNIEIFFKADGGKQYQFKIESTNIDFQKPDFNNLLFINFSIDKIELGMNQEQLALIQNAVKFDMIAETKNNRVNTKVDGKISTLDIVLNQKQTISVLETIQYYLKLTDELDKIVQEFFGVNDNQNNETELLHSIKNQPTDLSIIGSQTTFKKIQKEQNIIHSYMDTLNNNIQHSLAQHPIQKQQEKQFIEFSQSIFQSTDKSLGKKSLRNQNETFKCQFDGVRFAICEKSSTFPSLNGRFFQDLESHFFVEITTISVKYHQDQINFSVKSIGAHRIKGDSNTANTLMQSQEFFKSCLENPKISFQVTPVIMMGLAEVGKIEQDYAIYNFDKLQEQCKKSVALEAQIQIYHGKKREKFYQAQITLSDFIASFNHDLILKLLTYLPQKQVQLVQTEEKEKPPCLFGFDISCPYININYCFLNKPIQTRIKDIKLKQSPVEKFPHKLGILEPLDCVPVDQKPYQFILVSFFSIWVEFQGANILTIGQNVVTDMQIFPLFYLSFHQKNKNQIIEFEQPQKNKNQNRYLSDTVNDYNQSSEFVIKGGLPLIEIKLTQDLLFWLISIQSQLQNPQQKKNPSHIKKHQEENTNQYFQLTIDQLSVHIQDCQNKDLFSLVLQKLSIIQTNKLIVLFQDLTFLDCQVPDLIFNQRKVQQQYQKYPAHQIMIYRSTINKGQAQSIAIGRQKKKFYSQFLDVDFTNYIFKLIMQENSVSISIKDICLRIPDLSFKSFFKLKPLFQQFQIQKQKLEQLSISQQQIIQQQELQYKIKLKQNIFIDIFPIKEIEELTYDGLKCSSQISNGRILIHLFNLIATNDQIQLEQVDLFVCRQNGFEFQCPLVLENKFDKLNVFQFQDCIKVCKLKFKENVLDADQFFVNFTFDMLQTLLEIVEDILPFIPQGAPKKATEVNYVIDTKFDQRLIKSIDPDTNIEINIPSFQINLLEGHKYFQQPIYVDDLNYTFEEEIENFILMFDKLEFNQPDSVSFKFYDTQVKLEIYNQGQMGLRLKTVLEIYDQIKQSQYQLVMSPDSELIDNQNNLQNKNTNCIELGLILEDQAYSAMIKLPPLRICISGYFLQFMFNFFKSQSYIKSQIFEDEIQICQKMAQKQIIKLKSLQIIETTLNFSYDSQGLIMDAFVKGILKISSFYDLNIPLKYIHVSLIGTSEEIVAAIISQFQVSLGSKIKITGKALQSLEAFSVIKNLVSGALSLVLSPLQEGLVAGTKKGISDFSNSFFRALLKAIEIPTSAIVAGGEQFGLERVAMPFKYVNERSSQILVKISPQSIPKRFYKNY